MPSRKRRSQPVTPNDGQEPKPARPRMPKGYGISNDTKGLLTWNEVRERLSTSRNYWVATTRPDGRPHVMPVWGLWSNGMFYFSTDRNSRKARNLAANSAVVLHLESGDEVTIVEGVAREVTDPSVLRSINTACREKYGMGMSGPPGAVVVICSIQPRTVFAWRERDFPQSATRWQFPA